MDGRPPRLYARLRPDRRRFALLATGTFLVVGAVFLAVSIAFLVLPFLEQRRAVAWIPVPCVVVRTVQDEDGSRMIMAYDHAGRTYRSERVGFYPVPEGAYAEGTHLTGWMDPEHPEAFVLDRDQGPGWVAVVVTVLCTVLPLSAGVRMAVALAGRGHALEGYFTAQWPKDDSA